MIKAYLCDRKKCEDCSYPDCKHTTDITHAKNPHANNFIELEKGMFIERVSKNEN